MVAHKALELLWGELLARLAVYLQHRHEVGCPLRLPQPGHGRLLEYVSKLGAFLSPYVEASELDVARDVYIR